MNDLLNLLLASIGQENFAFCNDNRLELIRSVANQLNLLNWDIPKITVTGTNGKGSTVAALRTIYQLAGYHVATFSSPHLIKINERITVDGVFISDEEFINALQTIKSVSANHSLSFFEILTLVALYHFKQHQPDVIVIEVGLGGRLDATNIVDADVVVVTNVDYDHQDVLGDTREKIGFEKAGLFRQNAMAVYADLDCPSSVKELAKHLHVKFSQLGTDYVWFESEGSWCMNIHSKQLQFPLIPRIHANAMSSAIYVSELLQARLPIQHEHLVEAVQQTFIPGRLQIIDDGEHQILLDVSHNPHAMKHLIQHIQARPPSGRIHAIFSAFKDKDCEQIVLLFNKLNPLWYTTVLKSERSHSSDTMVKLFNDLNVKHLFLESATEALCKARAMLEEGDMIVVFGSFYLIREIMLQLQQEGKNVF
jgi:dihydrofolate synthase/folylpolyglutamate synthase